MTGIDNLDYMTSTSTSTGSSQITLTFTNAANPDTAQVQVQNKLQLVTSTLPQSVQKYGDFRHEVLDRIPDGGRLRLDRRQTELHRSRRLRQQHAERHAQAPGRRRRHAVAWLRLRHADLARSRQAGQIRADARRRRHRDRGPEHADLRRSARRPAGPQGSAAHGDRHRAQPPPDRRAIPQHHSHERHRRLAGPAERRRHGRARRRKLHHDVSLQRPAGGRPRHQAGDRRQRHQHGAERPERADAPVLGLSAGRQGRLSL